jgi:membrane-bound serine protease (ClpP class)
LRAADGDPTVTLLEVDGTITPIMATYIDRGIDDAIERGDAALILEMDTPGGLSSAMDEIIRDILASPIPVIVYVAPDGARAASAGMYITYAAHVAAMAPTTNIGSATPINLGGEEDTELTASERKVINDAVAQVTALAELRGRNAEWAEGAVREADNVTASQALELGVIDLIATDVNDLLAQSHGRVVSVPGGTATVNTANAEVRRVDMNLFEETLQVVSNPNIAFVLLSLGTLALIFELSNPGLILPGVAGGLMMLLGFYSLGTLDTNWAGLGLMLFAFILWVAEVFVPSHGVLTIGGVIAFVIGGLLLSNSQNDEVLQLSKVVIFTVAALLGGFFLLIVAAAARSRKLPVTSGAPSIVGAVGVARTDIDPLGMVFLQGELWQATSTAGPIAKGEQVQVAALRGIKLDVEPLAATSEAPPIDPAMRPA